MIINVYFSTEYFEIHVKSSCCSWMWRNFLPKLISKKEESWLCFFNSGSRYIWLGLQSSLILSHVTLHYGEASGKETYKRFSGRPVYNFFCWSYLGKHFCCLFWQIGFFLKFTFSLSTLHLDKDIWIPQLGGVHLTCQNF